MVKRPEFQSLFSAVWLCAVLFSTAGAWDESKPKTYSVRGDILSDGSRKVINFDTWGSIEMYSTATVVGKSSNSYSFGVVAPNSWYPQSGHDLSYQLIVTTQGYVGIATASPVGLFTVGNGTLTVLSNGNVGIGTAKPAYSLDVNGMVNAGYLKGDGSQLTGVLTSYDSGWFAVSGNTNYTKTHSLGTTKVLINIYYSSDGVNTTSMVGAYTVNNVGWFGPTINSITTTQISFFTTGFVWGYFNSSGGFVSVSSGYYRIIMLKLP